MEKSDYPKENGADYTSKEVKEKVVYKVVPVPYYYPVPVDAEWYYKHYEPPMRNVERGYHGYEDPAFDNFPFPPPPLHGFPAPPRSRDFHYYPAGGREDAERYWRPVSPLYRNSSPSRGDYSPPHPNRESKKQSKENGEQRNSSSTSSENGERKDKSYKSTNNSNNNNNNNNTNASDDKSRNEHGDQPTFEARSVKSEGNESEIADGSNHGDDNNSGEIRREGEEITLQNHHKKKNESESNRKRKRYMMTFPYDQRKKTKDTTNGEFEKEEKNNNNIDSIEDISTNESPESNHTGNKGIRRDNSDERERTYMKQKSYPVNGGGPNSHYEPYMVMHSPPYMGGETGRSSRYPPPPPERSHSMYERHYEDDYKDHEITVHMNECEDDKKDIRYHPNGRRARTVFTRQQLLTLNNVFEKHPFVSGERMSELSDQLGLDRKIVKIWFQNKRQYARKKGSLVERNEEYYYEYGDRYNPSSAPPSMAAERF